MAGILSDDRLAAFQADPGATLAPVGGGLVSLSAGTRFLRQGGPVDHLFCVVSGTIKVEASDWDDKTLLICFQRRATFTGDVELFEGGVEATCTLTAVTDVVLWRMDLKTLKGRLAEFPWLVGLVAHGLALKLGDRARESARNQLCPLAVRYESYLEEMGAGGRPVPIDLAQTASLLAVSPRHLQRVIRDLVDQGKVVRRGRSLVVSRWA